MVIETKVFKLDKNNAKRVIKATVNILKNKGVIIYPTETLYGIGTDATDKKLVKKIFKIKNSKPSNKFISAVSDIDMAKRYFRVNKDIERLAEKFMPGPLTIVDEQGNSFRIPKVKIVLEIIKNFGMPIITTSANISEQEPIYKIKDVIKTFSGKVHLIIDAGNIPKRLPSTVFDIKTKQIIRRGPITKEQIMKIVTKNVLVGGCFNRIHSGHVYFLKQAKSYGKLIVVLTNDRNNKKPYAIPAKTREMNLEKLGIADKIVIGNKKDDSITVRKYKPEIIALGYDQKLDKKTMDTIKKMKIKIIRIKKFRNYSTRKM